VLARVGPIQETAGTFPLPFALPKEKSSVPLTWQCHCETGALLLLEGAGVTPKRRSSSLRGTR
jgi:hypothetical protein